MQREYPLTEKNKGKAVGTPAKELKVASLVYAYVSTM